jgi:hypothetical protein
VIEVTVSFVTGEKPTLKKTLSYPLFLEQAVAPRLGEP